MEFSNLLPNYNNWKANVSIIFFLLQTHGLDTTKLLPINKKQWTSSTTLLSNTQIVEHGG